MFDSLASTVKDNLHAISRIASVKLCLSFIFISGALLSTGLQAQISPREEEGALVQRALQAEIILRTTSSTEVDLCMDQAINGAWLLGDGSRSPPSHLVDRLRRASELCTDQERTDKERLATQLSRTIQRQAENASRLDEAKAAARGCIDRSRDEFAFRACLVSELGEGAAQVGWTRWQSLYRSKRN